jgi:hypothetical protein
VAGGTVGASRIIVGDATAGAACTMMPITAPPIAD